MSAPGFLTRVASRFAPRLTTVLLIVNATVLVLPLGSIYFLQVYENEIVRQKESALIAQGAYVAAVYRRALIEALGTTEEEIDLVVADRDYGHPVFPEFRNPQNPNLPYASLAPKLDLAEDQIRPPLPRRLPETTFGDPVSDRAGASITQVLFRAQVMTLDEVRVVDPSGRVVASTHGEEGLSFVLWEEVQRALQGEFVSLLRRSKPEKGLRSPLDALRLTPEIQVTVATPVLENNRVLGAVILTGTPSRISEVLYGNRGTLLSALGVLVLAVILLSLFTSLTISEPIQGVIRQTEEVSRGALPGPVRFPILHEVRMLTQAISRMARVLDERARYITTFARAVSHEFKTPLTAIRGTVEILRDDIEQMDPKDKQRFLANLDQDADRLDRLVGRLLELARADVAEPTGEALAWHPVAQALLERFEGDGLKGEIIASGTERTRIRMGAEVFESILANLLDNARQHGGKDIPEIPDIPYFIRVWIEASAREGFLHLQIRDDGKGISSANRERIFDSFFTTARRSGGTGLGLSIVRSLARAHGGDVLLVEGNRGTTFEVRVPLA